MSQIAQIANWQKERGLDTQEFNLQTELTNIVEEIFEMFDHPEARQRAGSDVENLILYMQMHGNEIAKKEQLADAFTDIIVFSVGALLKLGYCPECVMDEVIKEINSRTGKMIDGKWVKDTSEEARAKWHEADFKRCETHQIRVVLDKIIIKKANNG